MTSTSNIWKQLTSILSNLNNFRSLEVVDRVSETQFNFTPELEVRFPVSAVWKKQKCGWGTKMFLPHPRVKVNIVGSLRDREVACSASDRQGSNFESCVWRTVSSQSSHHPQDVLLAQFSLNVHKGGLKPDSFHFLSKVKCSNLEMKASASILF